jgi:hypothetical protein
MLSTIALVVGLAPLALSLLLLGTPADPISDVTVQNLAGTEIIVNAFGEEKIMLHGESYTFSAIDYSGSVEVRAADERVYLRIDSLSGMENTLLVSDVDVTSRGAE